LEDKVTGIYWDENEGKSIQVLEQDVKTEKVLKVEETKEKGIVSNIFEIINKYYLLIFLGLIFLAMVMFLRKKKR